MAKLIVDEKSLTVRSNGLLDQGLCDLRVQVASRHLLAEAADFARHVVEYQQLARTTIRPSETLVHGYWTVKFNPGEDHALDIWEADPQNYDRWIRGAEHTLHYWAGQRELCASLGEEFAPPHFSDFALVSDGVLERKPPIEGVRYPPDSPSSGWIFTTDLCSPGDYQSLKKVHLYHVTSVWPELHRIVGVPPGYYFRICSKEDSRESGLWFDKDIAKAAPL